jgi:glutamyl-tRNA synthetase
VKKTEKKITWLSPEGQELVKTEIMEFDYLITKDKLEDDDVMEDYLTPVTETTTEALCDENVKELKVGEIIQLERKGYFRVDRAYVDAKTPVVLFNIPTGSKTGL